MTSSSNRSIRYSICESCLLLGQFFGSLCSGYLIGNKINLANFVRVYIISFSLYVLVLIYIVVIFRILKRSKQEKASLMQQTQTTIMITEKTSNTDDTNNEAAETNQESSPTPRAIVVIRMPSKKSFLKNQLAFLLETWQLLSKPRENNSRLIIVSLLIMFFFGCSLSMGILSLQYLYLVKKPVELSQIGYGYFKAANTLCRAAALLIVLPILKRVFNTPDYFLFVLGFTSEFLNLVVFSLAYFYRYLIWLGIYIIKSLNIKSLNF